MSDQTVVDVDALARVGESGLYGRFRCEPADFQVEEVLSHPFDGAGEHLWLWVEKTGLTTPQAASRLASACDLPARQIGFAGLKDRHAVTRQWFSVTWPIKAATPVWPDTPELRVLAVHRHGRKLKRGAHDANRFILRVRDVQGLDEFDSEAAGARVVRDGVPNYFGAQRFGRFGDNVELARALFAGRRLPRGKRSMALSAARSFMFNEVLDARVRDGSWNRAMDGDVFMLDGSHSVFRAADSDEDGASLSRRVVERDLHPTGPMPGRIGSRSRLPSGDAAVIEDRVLATHPDLCDGLVAAGVDADRRALRLCVDDWSLAPAGDTLRVQFSLPSGAFATTVLRELGRFVDAQTEPSTDD
ncbi:tRNA pseudouridine(13) synthase TruD [Salinisphaera sp. Q1T1-3]|uniref:tRNA pseudouridine(13) synthase TruD n=1 Tax=Salinisphaera sp. Q1T1-3 TaxID=2321229 RepID=UPI000E710490|nr:tRNA pseudouridine(13) synthase TruD [Salinisphaera sp. Q1T1-3]RJS95322.1 tRNA pseudouridine(13) synthase TruD [Salinisphaera sp. Q1T1-3]